MITGGFRIVGSATLVERGATRELGGRVGVGGDDRAVPLLACGSTVAGFASMSGLAKHVALPTASGLSDPAAGAPVAPAVLTIRGTLRPCARACIQKRRAGGAVVGTLRDDGSGAVFEAVSARSVAGSMICCPIVALSHLRSFVSIMLCCPFQPGF